MRSTRTILTSLSLAAAAMAAACTTATDLEPVSTVTLEPGLDSLEIGGAYNSWVVTLKDANGNTLTGRPLQWTSSNLTVATIDAATGEVSGIGSGESLITLRIDGKTALATIRVLLPVLSIVSSPDSFDLPLTTTRAIPATVVGPNGVALTNRQVIWSSANPSIAVVNTAGVVTAISLGTTTITIRAGHLTKQLRVRVVSEPVTSIRILPLQSVQVIRLGQTKQLTAECLNASQQVLQGRSITWNSGNPVAATVSGNGLVSAVSVGTANISATCDGTISASITAQVTLVPVTSVSITPNGFTLPKGSQGQLTPVARDSADNVLSLQGRQVNWFTSNFPVASVSLQGVVSATNTGTAEITVSVDGVTSPPVTVTVGAFLSALIKPIDTPIWARRAEQVGER